ncbi:hypothetical protein PHYBOEH_001147 [Phytophthora boehmeriae]|uniref:EF-hand domain-containing protein n=1 Tax=Phytophthora boehmeriae TaxID=109152 RepID=A0A8T1WY93_9STRA|nr:hypothetical protein PHYBOEH_001147 [Phytophthora boehmeriae]
MTIASPNASGNHISVDLDVDEIDVPLTSTPENGDYFVDLHSPPPQAQSMRLRLRKRASSRSALSSKTAENLKRRVARVKKKRHPRESRVFRRNLQLAVRIAVGVMLAGVIQTRGSSREWLFLPESYYLGGLTVASMMVIYAAANTFGGVLEQVWQIDVGVAIALLYNFVIFACIPITQGNLITVSQNIDGTTYYVSLHDWGVTLPLLAMFTLIVLLSPMQTNVKKFAVSTNLYFTLTLVDPMNPIFTTVLKDISNSSSYYGTDNLLKQLAIYSGVGVVGTLIALLIMLLPYPIFAMRKLRRQIAASPHDIRDILNLIVDSYCFRAKDIKKMDFFKIRLDRLFTNAHNRLKLMESLLNDCWWEELIGLGLCFRFNKTMVKQHVKLYAKLLSDLHAMKFAIEAETCHWTHAVLLNKMQTRFYVLQADANDLLDDISLKIVQSSRSMSTPKFASLNNALERLMSKYASLYGNLLSADVHTADDVGKTMPLNVFVYSFHAFVITLLEFEGHFNGKNFSTRYRTKNFLRLAWRGLLLPVSYPLRKVIFAFRTTLAVIIGICCSTFIFGFDSTAPTAIAMVAEDNIGGTYGNTVNRLGGLVAGTVVPSIFSFFVCKASSDYLYNTLNNIVIFVWTVGSMYVWFCRRYMALAGMTSAFMAASVLLNHSCRSSATATVSYASLTQNALGILILLIVEVLIYPRSSRGLLRSNVQQLLTQYRSAFKDVFRHHVAYNQQTPNSAEPLTEDDIETANSLLSRREVKELKEQLKVTIPEMLLTQAKLVNDADMEPTLWKPPFSTAKYTEVVSVCQELVEQLGVLIDLVDWHENRRSSGKDKRLRRWGKSRLDAECAAAFSAAQEPPSPTSVAAAAMAGEADPAEEAPPPADRSPHSPVPSPSPAVAKIMWDQSLAVVEAGVDETFDTLVVLFGEEFSASNAEDHAIYLQMKEAFRIADVHRRGVVDATELVVLLDKLMPYAGRQGVEAMDQYVDEFMQLVDTDNDGKISFNEFMQALNEGFRLELEIYDEQPQVAAAELLSSKDSSNLPARSNSLRRKSSMGRRGSALTDSRLRRTSIQSNSPGNRARRTSVQSTQPDSSARRTYVQPTQTEDYDDAASLKQTKMFSPPQVPSSFVDTSTLESSTFQSSKLGSFLFGDSNRRHRFRGMSSASDFSAPEALLNVESFTLTEAAAALKQSYGECLLALVDDHSRRVTMEDFIVMSCVISACENIAANLMRLNTLAAS